MRLIEPKLKDLGGFHVRRALPHATQRMVGPFIFFDHAGPARLPPGEGIDVRPHPHIGLATLSYLFSGEIMHRDSLGVVQAIQPGAVNLMTAGAGIVHSERSGEDRSQDSVLELMQSWIALPTSSEEMEPAFDHYPAGDLPELDKEGVRARLIMGEGFGERSPVKTYSPTFYAAVELTEGASIDLPEEPSELAVYVVSGAVDLAATRLSSGALAVFEGEDRALAAASGEARTMVLGGEPVGERHIWWNFVSSSKARIEQAKEDWQSGRFPAVPGETEFIPLPD